MKTHRLPLIAALMVPCPVAAQLALAPRTIDAIPTDRAAETAASDFRGHRIEGRELDAAVEHVLEDLDWHERLGAAVAAAEQTGKPIVWVQLLGDLDGFT